VDALSERLLIAPHTSAELATRMVDAGLLFKEASTEDRRRIHLALTAKAETMLSRLSATHLQELKLLEPALIDALARLSQNSS
jgi:DNA-binding MarR family transcriptional regulator